VDPISPNEPRFSITPPTKCTLSKCHSVAVASQETGPNGSRPSRSAKSIIAPRLPGRLGEPTKVGRPFLLSSKPQCSFGEFFSSLQLSSGPNPGGQDRPTWSMQCTATLQWRFFSPCSCRFGIEFALLLARSLPKSSGLNRFFACP